MSGGDLEGAKRPLSNQICKIETSEERSDELAERSEDNNSSEARANI